MAVIEHEWVETPLPDLAQPDEIAKLLERAADLIEERGWAQGEMQSPDRRFCALGAIAYAQTQSLVWTAEADVAARRLAERGIGISYHFSSSVFRWNDFPGRTKEQVVAAFRRASAT